MVTKHEKIFVQKLRQLLSSPTFDDIAFNCKDGKVSGNRLILALYSPFLRKIFEDNPNIVSHPLNDDTTSGINITEIEVKDLENLLRLLNTQTSADFDEDSMKGITSAARLTEIELKVDKLRNGLVRIRAIPDLIDDNPKKKVNGGKAIVTAFPKKNESEMMSPIKETKAKRRSRGRNKQQSKMKNKTESLSSTSTVCPYCNITCKSVRGLQVHIGYIHKNEVKNVKHEINEKDMVTDPVSESSKAETNSKKSCGTEKIDLLVSVTSVASGDLPMRCEEQNLTSNSLLFVNNASDKPLSDPAFDNGDHEDGQTIIPMIDNVWKNNGEHINQCCSYSVTNFVSNPNLANPSLVEGVSQQNFSDPPVRVANLPQCFTLLPKQQEQGTLICLPKTQLYEQIETGYSCGICEMKFPNLANLNFHMTYSHGLTILVKEN